MAGPIRASQRVFQHCTASSRCLFVRSPPSSTHFLPRRSVLDKRSPSTPHTRCGAPISKWPGASTAARLGWLPEARSFRFRRPRSSQRHETCDGRPAGRKDRTGQTSKRNKTTGKRTAARHGTGGPPPHRIASHRILHREPRRTLAISLAHPPCLTRRRRHAPPGRVLGRRTRRDGAARKAVTAGPAGRRDGSNSAGGG
jgi:hypothetical protein